MATVPFALSKQHPNIPCLSVHVTTDVYHSRTAEAKQLVDEVLVATFTRGVDDHRCLRRREVGHRLEDVSGIARTESDLALGEVVEPCVPGGGGDGVGRELDAGDFGEVGRKHDGEEAASAVCVNEMGGDFW